MPGNLKFAAPLAVFIGLVCMQSGCQPQYIPEFLGGGWYKSQGDSGSFTLNGPAFTEELVQARTFTSGTSVTTLAYLLNDRDGADAISDADVLLRKPFGIDFNGEAADRAPFARRVPPLEYDDDRDAPDVDLVLELHYPLLVFLERARVLHLGEGEREVDPVENGCLTVQCPASGGGCRRFDGTPLFRRPVPHKRSRRVSPADAGR